MAARRSRPNSVGCCGTPRRLYDGADLKIATGNFMPNGELLAVRESDDEKEITRIEVVLGWDRELAHKLK